MKWIRVAVLAVGILVGTSGCWGGSPSGACAEEQMAPGEECHDTGTVP